MMLSDRSTKGFKGFEAVSLKLPYISSRGDFREMGVNPLNPLKKLAARTGPPSTAFHLRLRPRGDLTV